MPICSNNTGKVEKEMNDRLIAPCGMNCGLCLSYQAQKYDLKKRVLTENTALVVFRGERAALSCRPIVNWLVKA